MGMFTVDEKCISVYVLTGDLPFFRVREATWTTLHQALCWTTPSHDGTCKWPFLCFPAVVFYLWLICIIVYFVMVWFLAQFHKLSPASYLFHVKLLLQDVCV